MSLLPDYDRPMTTKLTYKAGGDFEDLNPPRTLCRSCRELPGQIPPWEGWCCRIGFRPLRDGSCRFYERELGSDDE